MSWTEQSKHSSSFTPQAKSSSSFTDETKHSTSFTPQSKSSSEWLTGVAYLLTELSGYLLQENGGKIVLEQSPGYIPQLTWINQTKNG